MSNIRVVNLSSYTAPVVKEVQGKDWVEYGEGNSYFQYLIDRYNGSATNNAIINGIVELLYGRGLDASDSNRKPDEYAQMKALFSKNCLRRLLSDYKMMGQCAIQVIYSQDRTTIVQVDHLPIESLRAERCNEEGEVEAYYYAKDWSEVAARKETPMRIPAFGYSEEAIEIMYVKPYRAGYYYYSPVDYQGGLQYAELEEEVANYHINNIQNGLAPSMLLNMNNGVPTEEERNLIEARIAEKFSGSSNAGRFILAFNDNKELAATIEPVQLSDASDQYQFLADESMRKLMVAHRVTSPMLLGIKDNSGLGNNANELETASALFENTVIEPMQEVIIDALNEILAYNDISLSLYFKTLRPLEFSKMKVGDSEVIEEETGVKVRDQKKFSKQEEELKIRIAETLIEKGEQLDDEWELIDERAVDYDKEDVHNALWNFASVIKSDPSKTSEQDTSIIKVRYKYASTGAASGKSRDFCAIMERASRVYRKEDIEDAGAVNAGFGPNGSSTYDIWLYKGGPFCQHYWVRQTYLRKNNTRISVNEARALITALDPSLRSEARIEQNPSEVATAPRDFPDGNYGYLNPPAWLK
jgi:hypothetical protein